MQSTHFHMALLFSLVSSSWAASSSKMLGDLGAMGDDGMVEIQFEPVDPEDVMDDMQELPPAFAARDMAEPPEEFIFNGRDDDDGSYEGTGSPLDPKDIE